jgi:hypothetical protein
MKEPIKIPLSERNLSAETVKKLLEKLNAKLLAKKNKK